MELSVKENPQLLSLLFDINNMLNVKVVIPTVTKDESKIIEKIDNIKGFRKQILNRRIYGNLLYDLLYRGEGKKILNYLEEELPNENSNASIIEIYEKFLDYMVEFLKKYPIKDQIYKDKEIKDILNKEIEKNIKQLNVLLGEMQDVEYYKNNYNLIFELSISLKLIINIHKTIKKFSDRMLLIHKLNSFLLYLILRIKKVVDSIDNEEELKIQLDLLSELNIKIENYLRNLESTSIFISENKQETLMNVIKELVSDSF